MNIQGFYLALLIICLIINVILVYFIFHQTKNINGGDILILSHCFNNILFCIAFIIQIIFNYVQIYDITNDISCKFQSFIITFIITLNSMNYFLIALRSYFKITFDYSLTNKNIYTCLIFCFILNFLCVLGFGYKSDYGISVSNTYCMFNYNSLVMLIWVYIILGFMFSVILYLYERIYNTTIISQKLTKKISKEDLTPRRTLKDKKTLAKRLTLNTITNKKLLRMIILRLSIYIFQIIIIVFHLILYNKYTDILWIITIIINILISSVVYGFSNNKVQLYLDKKPKLKIIINRLSEKKINIKTAFTESLPSPRINSMCIIIDKVSDEKKEEKITSINNEDSKIANVGSVENSMNVSSYSYEPELRIDPNLSPLSSPESSPEPPKNSSLPPIKKGKISPYDTSPSDLRKLRLKNIAKEGNYSLDIPKL